MTTEIDRPGLSAAQHRYAVESDRAYREQLIAEGLLVPRELSRLPTWLDGLPFLAIDTEGRRAAGRDSLGRRAVEPELANRTFLSLARERGTR